jgi:hypothetical protein
VGPGWRCLEVGSGGGSIAAWLCDRVGPDGSVLATDLDIEELLEGVQPVALDRERVVERVGLLVGHHVAPTIAPRTARGNARDGAQARIRRRASSASMPSL